ncbi:FecR domain-containing protein [Variovorax sp. LT1R16]|uniref:FecR domain-containing protein n=1 Tax=Variovorax sp. LT1R16 TaxID=3443728 RepID=UPI003F4464DC
MIVAKCSAQAALMACALVVGSVQAAVPPRSDLRHRVVAGETLQSLGERYLRSPSRWRELQAINHLADAAEPAPGSVIHVPRALLRSACLATAKVEFAQGKATGFNASASAATAGDANGTPDAPPVPLATGDAVTEGLRIQVPKDGYLRLRLADGSVVRVLADSDVELKRLRNRRATGSYESVIQVRRGKVESEVERQPKGRVFEIHAPGAVASVRGTRFAVAVSPEGRVSTAVTRGMVKVQPQGKNSLYGAEVQAGEGAVIEADGQLHKRPALPAPPDLSSLPAVLQDAGALVFDLPPPDGTLAGYEVRIARPESLREVLRNGTFESGHIQFPALDDGDYMVSVRAIDREGLTGPRTLRAFRVQAQPVPPAAPSPATGARITGKARQTFRAQHWSVSGLSGLFPPARRMHIGPAANRSSGDLLRIADGRSVARG